MAALFLYVSHESILQTVDHPQPQNRKQHESHSQPGPKLQQDLQRGKQRERATVLQATNSMSMRPTTRLSTITAGPALTTTTTVSTSLGVTELSSIVNKMWNRADDGLLIHTDELRPWNPFRVEMNTRAEWTEHGANRNMAFSFMNAIAWDSHSQSVSLFRPAGMAEDAPMIGIIADPSAKQYIRCMYVCDAWTDNRYNGGCGPVKDSSHSQAEIGHKENDFDWCGPDAFHVTPQGPPFVDQGQGLGKSGPVCALKPHEIERFFRTYKKIKEGMSPVPGERSCSAWRPYYKQYTEVVLDGFAWIRALPQSAMALFMEDRCGRDASCSKSVNALLSTFKERWGYTLPVLGIDLTRATSPFYPIRAA